MIYDAVAGSDPIRQGDVFRDLPFLSCNLEKAYFVKDNGRVSTGAWGEDAPRKAQVVALAQKTHGIVLSQDCDALRAPFVSLVRAFPWEKRAETPRSWMQNIVNCNTKQPWSLYLPPDTRFSLPGRMVVDFAQVFPIRRVELEKRRFQRCCRLNAEACEHFREKAANYFRRYAYAEHYPLDKREMDEYEAKHAGAGDLTRRPYQQ